MVHNMKMHRLLGERVMSQRGYEVSPEKCLVKIGPETRGACLEKILAREKNPGRKVEKGRGWVVFEEQGASCVIGSK